MDALRGKLSCPISHRLYMEEWDVNSNPELPDFRTHFLAGVRSIWTHAHIGTSLFPIPDSLMVMWLDISVLSHYWYSKGGKNWVKQNSNIQNIELNKQDIELKTSWRRLRTFLILQMLLWCFVLVPLSSGISCITCSDQRRTLWKYQSN